MDLDLSARDFSKLPLKAVRYIIKEYKLATKINTTKKVNGKNKALSKKELASELDNHLEISDDGEIIFKPKTTGSGKSSAEPKSINSSDDFYIYDSRGERETMDLTDYYKLKDVDVYENREDLLDQLGDVSLLTWDYMQEPRNPVKMFEEFIEEVRGEDYEEYQDIIKTIFRTDKQDEERVIQIFIYRKRKLISFIRSHLTTEEDDANDLHIDYVFVSDDNQGKGYVGEMMSLLFEYIYNKGINNDISYVTLMYAADSEAGWVAYDKGISRYGFKNDKLNYTNDDLKRDGFIKEIHEKFFTKNMAWKKEASGSGIKKKKRKLVEPIEMRI